MEASSAKQSPLYQKHIPIFTRSVKGKFRNFKTAVMVLAYSVYFLLPWMPWQRVSAADQAVLFDLGSRRFFIFDLIDDISSSSLCRNLLDDVQSVCSSSFPSARKPRRLRRISWRSLCDCGREGHGALPTRTHANDLKPASEPVDWEQRGTEIPSWRRRRQSSPDSDRVASPPRSP